MVVQDQRIHTPNAYRENEATMTPKEAKARVAHGAALLDQLRPGWAERITRPLDMASGCNCILGQLEGSYGAACQALGFSLKDAIDGGFGCIEFPMFTGYDLLQPAWIEAITERLTPPVQWTHRETVAATGVGQSA